MIKILVFLGGIIFISTGLAAPCQNQDLTGCISVWLSMESVLPSNRMAKGSESVGLLPPDNHFRKYHRALVYVQPEQAQQARSAIIDSASVAERQRQIEIFINLTLFEFFSGYSGSATDSLAHAGALSPDDSRIVMLKHFIAQATPLLETAIKQAGFSNPACGEPQQQIARSLRQLTSQPFRQLQQQVQALPERRLRLQALFLLARYMEALNTCLPHGEFYDFLVLAELREITEKSRIQRLASDTLATYEFYGKQCCSVSD